MGTASILSGSCWQSVGLQHTPVRSSWNSIPIRSMSRISRGNSSRFACRLLRKILCTGPRACWCSLRARNRFALNFLKETACCWFTTAPLVLGRGLLAGCWDRFRSLILANRPGFLRRVLVGIRWSFPSRNPASRCSGSRKPMNRSYPSRLRGLRMNIMSTEWIPKALRQLRLRLFASPKSTTVRRNRSRSGWKSTMRGWHLSLCQNSTFVAVAGCGAPCAIPWRLTSRSF